MLKNNRLYDYDAERNIILLLFKHPKIVSEISEIGSSAEIFNDQIYKVIFDIIKECYDNSIYIEYEIIVSKINNSSDNFNINNSEKIIKIIKNLMETNIDTYNNKDYFISKLKEKYMLRKIEDISKNINKNLYEENKSYESILDILDDEVYKLTSNKNTNNIYHLNSVTNQQIENILNKSSKIEIKTGFEELDNLTLGFHNSEVTVIASRPSVGKTSFALNLILNIILKQKKSVLFFTLEMSYTQILLKILSYMTNIPLQKLRSNNLTLQEQSIFKKAQNIMQDINLEIVDSNINISDIKKICKLVTIHNKIDIIFIDYIQLINIGDNMQSNARHYELAQICYMLKSLSHQLQIPIVIMSQLSRNADEKEEGKELEPSLSNLKSSGAIEESADNVMFLIRSKMNIKGESIESRKLVLLKQRNGPLGQLYFNFFPEISKFEINNDKSN